MIPDFLDLLEALLAAQARFLVVGGYAVGVHGYPRATKDLGIWVDATAQNAPRVMAALQTFGAPLHGLTEQDLRTAGVGLQIGVPPGRIDILTQISGVDFEQAWPQRLEASFFGRMVCPVIGRQDLITNKRASARAQDLADVEALEKLTPPITR